MFSKNILFFSVNLLFIPLFYAMDTVNIAPEQSEQKEITPWSTVWKGTPPESDNRFGNLKPTIQNTIARMMLPLKMRNEIAQTITLDLSNKGITTVADLSKLVALIKSDTYLRRCVDTLDLSGNRISRLDKHSFKNCVGCFSAINLAKNEIKRLTHDSFEQLESYKGKPTMFVTIEDGSPIAKPIQDLIDQADIVVSVNPTRQHVSVAVYNAYKTLWRDLTHLDLSENPLDLSISGEPWNFNQKSSSFDWNTFCGQMFLQSIKLPLSVEELDVLNGRIQRIKEKSGKICTREDVQYKYRSLLEYLFHTSLAKRPRQFTNIVGKGFNRKFTNEFKRDSVPPEDSGREFLFYQRSDNAIDSRYGSKVWYSIDLNPKRVDSYM